MHIIISNNRFSVYAVFMHISQNRHNEALPINHKFTKKTAMTQEGEKKTKNTIFQSKSKHKIQTTLIN